jgi:hypothetical protein
VGRAASYYYRTKDGSKTSGLPFTRFAPARKSAQIISGQQPHDLSEPSIRTAGGRRLENVPDMLMDKVLVWLAPIFE